jgi:hypothetical protein
MKNIDIERLILNLKQDILIKIRLKNTLIPTIRI